MKKKAIKTSQDFYVERIKDVENAIFVVQWYDKEDLEGILNVEMTDEEFIEFQADAFNNGIADDVNELVRKYYAMFTDYKEEV